MLTEPRPYRVLVPKADGSGHEFIDASAAQFHAYMANDPNWRSATDDTAPSLAERLWRRLLGRHTPT